MVEDKTVNIIFDYDSLKEKQMRSRAILKMLALNKRQGSLF